MELHDAEEAIGMRNQGEHSLDFYRFSWSYAGPKVQLAPPHENFINWRH